MAVLDRGYSSELHEVVSALLTKSVEKRPSADGLAVKLLSKQMQCTSLSSTPAAARNALAKEPAVRAKTTDCATAKQPAGRAAVGATWDGGKWVYVLSDDNDDSTGDESAAELPATREKLKKPKTGAIQRRRRSRRLEERPPKTKRAEDAMAEKENVCGNRLRPRAAQKA